MAEIVANHVKDANVGWRIKIFPSKSLFKPKEQYKPLSRGQLDMVVLPLSYAGGQQPSYNLTLMPGLVKNHDHAARLNYSPFMDAIQERCAEDDVMVLVHGYLAGGFVGKEKCVSHPDDVKGLQMRAAGKSFNQLLAGQAHRSRRWLPPRFTTLCRQVCSMEQIHHHHHSSRTGSTSR